MPVYLSPGVYIEELYGSRSAPDGTWADDCSDVAELVPIEMAGPGAAAFFGYTARMPLARDGKMSHGKPIAIGSWQEYVERFGGIVGGACLPGAVRGYFANGGKRCYVVALKASESADPTDLARTWSDVATSADRTLGFAALERLDDVTFVCAPDLMPRQQRDVDVATARAFQEAMISFAEMVGCVAILDTPADLSVDAVRTWRESLRDSPHAALYYPWIFPAGTDAGPPVPPSGHVAGAYVRCYEARGAPISPEPLEDVSDVELRVSKLEHDVLYPIGVNVLRAAPAGAIRISGGRTLSSEAAFQPVHVRTFLNRFRQSVQRSADWVLHGRIDEDARRRVYCALEDFLTRLWRSGAILGRTETESFYLKDVTDGPAADPVVEIGMALHQPGQFATLRIVFVSELRAAPDDSAASNPSTGESVATPAITVHASAARIFVSYGREDWEQFVQPLVHRLRDSGFDVWVDQHLLLGGEDWLDEINTALERCQLMILCISPDALVSKHVKLEYRYFFNNNKPILPVICRTASLLAELQGIQHLQYSDHEALIARVRAMLAS